MRKLSAYEGREYQIRLALIDRDKRMSHAEKARQINDVLFERTAKAADMGLEDVKKLSGREYEILEKEYREVNSLTQEEYEDLPEQPKQETP